MVLAEAGKEFPEGHRLGGYEDGLPITALLANEYGLKQALKVVSGWS
jgi:hypothetical protein